MSLPGRTRPTAATVTVCAATAAFMALPGTARANERHFTFTYESATLPQHGRELEVWTTPRLGRGHTFAQFDQRFEFEVGLTDRLMTAFYVNFSGSNETVSDPATMTKERRQSFDFGGVSSEWKYKLSDPVANAIGFALYGELLASPTEVELETKLIFDKQVGDVLLAANLVSELAREFVAIESEPELKLEAHLAMSYRLRPGLWLGVEARSESILEEAEKLESSTLHAGPTLAYATKGWWAAFTVTPQLPLALKSPQGKRDLEYKEALTARLLFSFHID